MKEWVLSVFVTVLLSSIVGMIAPEGKIGKLIKCIFSIIILLTVISPFTNLNYANFSNLIDFDNLESNVQINFIYYANSKNAKKIEEKVNSYLEKNGINNAEIKVDFSVSSDYEFKIDNININLKNSVINSDKEHIVVLDNIVSEISSLLNISKECISICE